MYRVISCEVKSMGDVLSVYSVLSLYVKGMGDVLSVYSLLSLYVIFLLPRIYWGILVDT